MNGNRPCEKNGQQRDAEKEIKGREERKRGGEIKKAGESDLTSDVGPLKRSPETLFQKRVATFCRRFTISRL